MPKPELAQLKSLLHQRSQSIFEMQHAFENFLRTLWQYLNLLGQRRYQSNNQQQQALLQMIRMQLTNLHELFAEYDAPCMKKPDFASLESLVNLLSVVDSDFMSTRIRLYYLDAFLRAPRENIPENELRYRLPAGYVTQMLALLNELTELELRDVINAHRSLQDWYNDVLKVTLSYIDSPMETLWDNDLTPDYTKAQWRIECDKIRQQNELNYAGPLENEPRYRETIQQLAILPQVVWEEIVKRFFQNQNLQNPLMGYLDINFHSFKTQFYQVFAADALLPYWVRLITQMQHPTQVTYHLLVQQLPPNKLKKAKDLGELCLSSDEISRFVRYYLPRSYVEAHIRSIPDSDTYQRLPRYEPLDYLIGIYANHYADRDDKPSPSRDYQQIAINASSFPRTFSWFEKAISTVRDDIAKQAPGEAASTHREITNTLKSLVTTAINLMDNLMLRWGGYGGILVYAIGYNLERLARQLSTQLSKKSNQYESIKSDLEDIRENAFSMAISAQLMMQKMEGGCAIEGSVIDISSDRLISHLVGGSGIEVTEEFIKQMHGMRNNEDIITRAKARSKKALRQYFGTPRELRLDDKAPEVKNVPQLLFASPRPRWDESQNGSPQPRLPAKE